MKRRTDSWLILLLLAGFVGVILWLLQRTEIEPEQEFSPLTTYSANPDGALALYDLTTAIGLEPQRFGDTEYHYPPQSCIVILESSDLGTLFGGPLDAKALRLWLERGGRLLLCAASSEYGIAADLLQELDADQPSPKNHIPRCEAVHLKAGSSGKITARSRFEQSGEIYRLPDTRFALFEGVSTIEHSSGTTQAVEAVQLLATDAPILWYRKVGTGELLWLTRPELVSNGWIGRADNHRLILNLLQVASHGRALYFDEHIHGYARATPNLMAILARTRGGHLLLIGCLLALMLFAGAAVRPAKYLIEAVPERRQGVEMVLAQADLYQRADARHVIADSLVDSLRRSFMERRHLATAPSDFELLEWVEEQWKGDGRRRRTLADYLRSRLLARSPRALLDLARATDDAKSMLM